MLEKRDYRIYQDIDKEKIYPQVCDFWARQGFYVSQFGPYHIYGRAYHSNIGLRMEFDLRIYDVDDNTYLDLMLRAKLSDEGLVGGAAAAVIVWPVAVVGGAVSYSEYEKGAYNLIGSFWAYTDQITGKMGQWVSAPPAPYHQSPAQALPQPEMAPCEKCGALLPKPWKACPYCGVSVEEGEIKKFNEP